MDNNVKVEGNYNNYLGIIKGLAIFLMIWGHCVQYAIPGGHDFFENIIFKTIYSFHMPLFMLISGYLFFFSFQKRSLGELLLRRIQPLLQTIIFGTIIIFYLTTGIRAIISGNYSSLVGGQWLSSLDSLWFLWSVLGASLLVGIICKKVKPFWLQCILLLLAMPILLLFPAEGMSIYMYPYYVIGFYFAKYKDKILKKIGGRIKYIVILFFLVMLMFFKKEYYIYTSGLIGNGNSLWKSIYIDAYRWLIGLLGSIAILIIVELLLGFSKNKEKLLVSKALSVLGKETIEIYTFSMILVSNWLPWIIKKTYAYLPFVDAFFSETWWGYTFYTCFVTLTIAIACSILLHFAIKLIRKIKISKIIFGK